MVDEDRYSWLKSGALPTAEDTAIWLRLGAHGRGWQFFMPASYLRADRLDAFLMRTAQQYRHDKGRDYTLALGPVLCGGAIERFTGLDDLEGLQ